MSAISKRRVLVNVIGAVFYLICMFQWLWSLMPYLPHVIKFINVPKPSKPVTIIPVNDLVVVGPPSPSMVIFAAAITVLFIGISIYVFLKLPSVAGKLGQKFTKSTAVRITPIVSGRAKMSAKKKRILNQRIVNYIKFTICLLPVIVVAFSYQIESQITYSLTMFVAGFLALIAIFVLVLQLLVARWLRVNLDKVY
ncbi:MAG TPA: hypothetical protein PKC86_02065 [Candidatus Saccharibacteria bacterium]|nr:hypothetical protein [Candidatus Saccharibacteria bacterium]